MQYPNEPDVTARTKAGKIHVGFVGNVEEVYNENGSLITDADIQSNFHSGSDFMKEYIQSKKDSGQEEQIIADGVFYSSENAEATSAKRILIVTTSLTGNSTIRYVWNSNFRRMDEF